MIRIKGDTKTRFGWHAFEQFSERFDQFRNLEQTIKIIKYPDIIAYSILELKNFLWMQIDYLEMQHADFQDSLWINIENTKNYEYFYVWYGTSIKSGFLQFWHVKVKRFAVTVL